MKCGKTAFSSRAKQVWAATLLSVIATIAKAQDGAAGISEADSQAQSYFEPDHFIMHPRKSNHWCQLIQNEQSDGKINNKNL
jgi:predicted Zn-dependent protease